MFARISPLYNEIMKYTWSSGTITKRTLFASDHDEKRPFRKKIIQESVSNKHAAVNRLVYFVFFINDK